MSLKIIGAGFGRTGTLSLKFALEKLGFDACYHMFEVFKNPHHRDIWIQASRSEPVGWEALFEGYQAAVDWPSCNFWREQMAAFPDAKVLLSLRDGEAWYKSVMNTIWATSKKARDADEPEAREGIKMAFEVIWDAVFDGRMDDKEHVIDCFNRHNQAVIDAVPPEKLLVYQPGDGWEPLCEFLGCPIPDEPYPKVNTTEEFQNREPT